MRTLLGQLKFHTQFSRQFVTNEIIQFFSLYKTHKRLSRQVINTLYILRCSMGLCMELTIKKIVSANVTQSSVCLPRVFCVFVFVRWQSCSCLLIIIECSVCNFFHKMDKHEQDCQRTNMKTKKMRSRQTELCYVRA